MKMIFVFYAERRSRYFNVSLRSHRKQTMFWTVIYLQAEKCARTNVICCQNR